MEAEVEVSGMYSFYVHCWAVLPSGRQQPVVPREHFDGLQLKHCLYVAIDFLYQELPTQWNLAPVRQRHPLLNRVEAGSGAGGGSDGHIGKSSATVLTCYLGTC